MIFSLKFLIKFMCTIGLLQSILREVKSSNKALWEKVEQLERRLDETSERFQNTYIIIMQFITFFISIVIPSRALLTNL